MSINTMEVYIKCPFCGEVSICYDYHENTSSDRCEYFEVLSKNGSFSCTQCSHRYEYDDLFTSGFCSVENKDTYKKLLLSKLESSGDKIFFSDWDYDFYGEPRITEQPALDRLIVMYPEDDEFKQLAKIYRWFHLFGKKYFSKLETGNHTVTRKEILLSSCLRKVYLRNGVEIIGQEAFKNCVNLTDIFLPDSVIEIGAEAFMDSGLKTIRTSDRLEKMGDRAFAGCKLLSKFFFPSQIRVIGENCFENCVNLKYLYIPDQVTIGRNAFKGCSGLEKIELPESLKVYGTEYLGLMDDVQMVWY